MCADEANWKYNQAISDAYFLLLGSCYVYCVLRKVLRRVRRVISRYKYR